MTYKVIFIIAVFYNYKLKQMNVKMTFLHSDLKEEVYVVQLNGYEKKRGEVCLHFLPHCRRNRLRGCVKLSASFCYLSGFGALRRFREHAEFARANSLLRIKVFPFADRRPSYRATFP